MRGFDLVMLVIGVAFAFTAYKVKKHIPVEQKSHAKLTKTDTNTSLTVKPISTLAATKETS